MKLNVRAEEQFTIGFGGTHLWPYHSFKGGEFKFKASLKPCLKKQKQTNRKNPKKPPPILEFSKPSPREGNEIDQFI
jgi:hypothetical protein